MNHDIKFKNPTGALLLWGGAFLWVFICAILSTADSLELFLNFDTYFPSEVDVVDVVWLLIYIALGVVIYAGAYITGKKFYLLCTTTYKFRNIFSKHKITSTSDVAKLLNVSDSDAEERLIKFIEHGYFTGLKTYRGKVVYPNNCELTSFVDTNKPDHIKSTYPRKLEELYDQGLITDYELHQAKGQIYGKTWK